MRIFPLVLIVIGALGVAKHFGLIPIGAMHLVGPVLLIALGVALLVRRPRVCHGARRARHGGAGSGTPQQPSSGLA